MSFHSDACAAVSEPEARASHNSLVTSHGFAASAAIPTGAAGAAAVAASVPASLDLAGTQRPQTQTYYCGPASAMSIVLSWHNHNAVLYPTTSAYEPGLGLSQLNLADVTYTNADPQGLPRRLPRRPVRRAKTEPHQSTPRETPFLVM